MRIPWIRADVYRNLSPKSIKVLCLIAARGKRGRLRTKMVDLAPMAAMSRSSLRRAIQELGDAGLLVYEATPSKGIRFLIPYTKRFTHVPSGRLHLLMALSPTAVKVLVTLCRALKPTRTIRMYVRTIADRIGRCARSAQLALAEIRRAGLSWAIRTGRSSIHVVDEQRDLFRPEIAHRSGLLLRVLTSTPQKLLSSTLWRLRNPAQEHEIRDTMPSTRSDERWINRALASVGVDLDERTVLTSMYTSDELVHAMDLLAGRMVSDVFGFIRTVIGRGWCCWSTC